MHYVYIIESKSNQNRRYIGIAEDLRAGVKDHNDGKVEETAEDRPWRLETAVYFRSRSKAEAFEKYLHTPAGETLEGTYF